MSTPTPGSIPKRQSHTQVIDGAMAELEGLDERELPEVLERLTIASEVLTRVLDTSADSVQTSIPGVR